MFEIKQNRIIAFLTLCIGARLALSYLALVLNGQWLKVLSGVLLAIGIGFLVIYFGDLRKTGIETGGERIWWNYLRPVHGILYLVAGVLLLYKNKFIGSRVIVFDTMIGLAAFINHYFTH